MEDQLYLNYPLNVFPIFNFSYGCSESLNCKIITYHKHISLDINPI